jgi:hypothetical protein
MITYYYDTETKAFYSSAIHQNIPKNAQEWTEEEYKALMNPPKGQYIDYSGDSPMLKAIPENTTAPLTAEQKLANAGLTVTELKTLLGI